MTALVNDTRLKDLFSDVRELGRDSAKGMDALPKLAIRVTQAAADRVIGTDEAKSIYAAYLEAESAKRVHSEAGKEANASKLRQFIALGAGMHDEGVELLSRAATIRNEMVKDTKVLPAYQAFLNVARAQLKDTQRGILLSDDEIRDLIVKPGTKTKEELEKLEAALKSLEKIQSGAKDTGDGACPSPQLAAAIDQIRDRMDEIVHAAKDAELMAALKERGLTVVQVPVQSNDQLAA